MTAPLEISKKHRECAADLVSVLGQIAQQKKVEEDIALRIQDRLIDLTVVMDFSPRMLRQFQERIHEVFDENPGKKVADRLFLGALELLEARALHYQARAMKPYEVKSSILFDLSIEPLNAILDQWNGNSKMDRQTLAEFMYMNIASGKAALDNQRREDVDKRATFHPIQLWRSVP